MACRHLHEAQRLPRDFEIAFVAMKVYDTEWATQLAMRHLTADSFVVSSQNCSGAARARRLGAPGGGS